MLGNLKNKSHFIKGKRERQNAEIGMGKAELGMRNGHQNLK